MRVNRRMALLLTLLHFHTCFVLPRTLPLITILAEPLPQPPFSTFSPLFYLPILLFLFRTPKLRAHFCLVHCSKSVLQHLIGNVAPSEGDREIKASSHVYVGNHALVLILAVDINAHTTVEEI